MDDRITLVRGFPDGGWCGGRVIVALVVCCGVVWGLWLRLVVIL